MNGTWSVSKLEVLLRYYIYDSDVSKILLLTPSLFIELVSVDFDRLGRKVGPRGFKHWEEDMMERLIRQKWYWYRPRVRGTGVPYSVGNTEENQLRE